MDGRRGIAIAAAETIMASPIAALRELGVRWNCVWLESASNHSADTRTGLESQSARRQSMHEAVAEYRAMASAMHKTTTTPARSSERKKARTVEASGNR